ncbi:hypothetical protein ACP4OV_017783 [Aristida adscensionis]
MADSPPLRKPRLEEAAAEAPDLLSALPLEVLDKILSRLHIYTVVRTSALSRAWRRRWEALPTVDLTRSGGILAHEVDALLLRRAAPLRAFRLAAVNDAWYVDALHDWLLYLSRNGVEDLFLWFRPAGFRLHSSLFSCRGLASLTLTNCRVPPAPPGFAGFPSLRTLRLDRVAISEHGGRELAALVAASPFVETVDLDEVELVGDELEDEWVTRAPNLRVLSIGGPFPYGGRVEHLPRLETGYLVGCNYAKFLMGMAQVTKLVFATTMTWSTEVDVLDRLPFLFENLRSLIVSVNFSKMSEILCLCCLLRSASFLEELTVWVWTSGTQEVVADVSNEEAAIAIKEYPRASPDAQVIFLGNEFPNTGSTNTSTENAEVEKTQTRKSGQESVDTSTDDAKAEEVQIEDSEHGSVTTVTEVEEIQTTGSRRGCINMSTDNAKVDETQTTDNRHDSIDTSAENAEVEKPQTEGSKRGSITTSTENAEVEETQTMGHDSTAAENVKVDETQTTDNRHDSIDTSAENAEVEKPQTEGSKRGSITTSTENADVEETQTMGHDSTAAENVNVDETQKTGSTNESINMTTETAEVEERQTAGSGLVYNVCHRRRQRLDLASVAQLEELEEYTRELQKHLQLDLESRKRELEDRKRVLGYLKENRVWQSCLKEMSEHVNITLPPFPQPSSLLSSHMATLREGDAHVNHGVNGVAGAHVDSPEDHIVNGPSTHANYSEGHA